MLLTIVFAASSAPAAVPTLDHRCPGNLQVRADPGGPVYINGKQRKLKRVNDSFYEASGAGVTLSISTDPNGAASVSYTGRGRTHGVCQAATESSSKAAAASVAPRVRNPKAESACLAAVAKQTNVARKNLIVTDVLSAEAGIGVTVKVPGADAPWSCLVDRRGRVQGASYTGSEGKL